MKQARRRYRHVFTGRSEVLEFLGTGWDWLRRDSAMGAVKSMCGIWGPG